MIEDEATPIDPKGPPVSKSEVQTDVAARDPQEETDWRDALPEELRKFAANIASPVEAVKMAAGLRQKLSKAIVPPQPNAREDEVADFRRRLGVPDSAEDYRIVFPKELPERLRNYENAEVDRAEFLEAMHEVGATQEIVQAAIDWYGRRIAVADQALADSREADRQRSAETLTREWGSDFERNMDYARRAALAYGGDGLVERFDQHGLGNDPALLRAFYRIGREIGEDEVFADGARSDNRRKLEERARELRSRKDRWTNRDVDRELRQLMEELHGTRAIQGTRS